MGPVADPNNPFAMRMDVIYSFVIPVSGCSDSITTIVDPVYNNGNDILRFYDLQSSVAENIFTKVKITL
jgi:hypothetical protein